MSFASDEVVARRKPRSLHSASSLSISVPCGVRSWREVADGYEVVAPE